MEKKLEHIKIIRLTGNDGKEDCGAILTDIPEDMLPTALNITRGLENYEIDDLRVTINGLGYHAEIMMVDDIEF